jgi:hypothetical protein
MLLGWICLLALGAKATTAAVVKDSQLPPGYKVITQDGFVFKDQQHLRDVAALHGFVKKVRFDISCAPALHHTCDIFAHNGRRFLTRLSKHLCGRACI